MGKKIIRFFIGQRKAVSLLVLFIVGAGFYTLLTSSKEAFPTIDFRQINITTYYPGASAEIVEKLITKKIEDNLEGIAGEKKITSISAKGISRIVFEVDETYAKGTIEVARNIKSIVENINDFPSDMTERPSVVRIDDSMVPVISVVVAAKDDTVLAKSIEKVEREVRNIEGISRIDKVGFADYQMQVEINPEKLLLHDTSILEASEAVASKNTSSPAGTVEIEGRNIDLRSSQEYTNINEIPKTVVRGNDYGNNIYLKDIAKVDWYQDKPDTYQKFEGKNAIYLIVYKNPGSDIIKTVDKVKNVIAYYKEEFKKDGIDVGLSYSNDFSFYVKRRLSLLTSNGVSGIILAIIILVLFLDARSAFWTALEIPVAFLASLIILHAMGVTINLMSMVGFIIVVGMLVDDAIVVSENTHTHLMMGKNPLDAAVDGTAQVLSPVVASVLTTVAAFLPIVTVSGQFGQFLTPIAVTVCVTMLVSLFDALFILPSHLSHSLVAPNLNEGKKSIKEKTFDVFKDKFFKPILKVLLKAPFITAFVIFVFFAVSVYSFYKFVPKEFFSSSLDEIRVNVEFNDDYSKDMTDDAIAEAEKAIRSKINIEDVRDIITTIGKWPNDRMRPQDNIQSNLASIQISLNVEMNEGGAKTIASVTDMLKDFKSKYHPKQLLIVTEGNGPEVGRDFEIKITGDSYEEVKQSNAAAEALLKSLPNTDNIGSSLMDDKKELLIYFDNKLTKQFGIDVTQIPLSIQATFQGKKASRLHFLSYISTEDPYIIVQYEKGYDKYSDLHSVIDVINSINVSSSKGILIPLKRLVKIVENNTTNVIHHENKKNIVYVNASIKDKSNTQYTTVAITSMLEKKLDDLKKQFPKLRFSLGGQKEEQKNLQQDAIFAFAVGLSSIFLILLALFRTFTGTFLIMIVIPFGVSGLFFGLSAQFFIHKYYGIIMPSHYYTFSFMNVVGLVALSGVLVNDSSVLISFVNELRSLGYTSFDAVLEGTCSRLRPILLTTFTTQAGIFPFAYGLMGGEPFLQPLVMTLVWGIGFGTIITLVLLPSLYIIIDRIKSFLKRGFPKQTT